jgi:hypothetical protein
MQLLGQVPLLLQVCQAACCCPCWPEVRLQLGHRDQVLRAPISSAWRHVASPAPAGAAPAAASTLDRQQQPATDHTP